MILFRLAWGSMWSRRVTIILTIVAIALSATLFLGVDKVRNGARASFADTISETDLIMGARSGSVQLLLYSVFRIGNATNNVSWQTYQEIAARPEVDWIVPLSLGDSHRGFRVLGTTVDYFDRYAFRGGQHLNIADGARFADLFDVVLGADVARSLGYELGDQIIVAHGLQSFSTHDNKPFTVSGILAKTGTPVDRTLFVSLEAIEAIHVDWQGGAVVPGTELSGDEVRGLDLTPTQVTAAMIGVSSPLDIFNLQRAINDYEEEPLLAVLPGVALAELWEIVGVAETALTAVSAMVIATALIGMAAMIFSSLNERRREMAILRAVGATPLTIVGLMLVEALIICTLAVLLGMALLYAGLWVFRPVIDAQYGIYLPITAPGPHELWVLLAIIGAGALVSLFPALRAYRMSLADGMTIRF